MCLNNDLIVGLKIYKSQHPPAQHLFASSVSFRTLFREATPSLSYHTSDRKPPNSNNTMSNFNHQPYGQPGYQYGNQAQGTWSTETRTTTTTNETQQSQRVDQNGHIVSQQVPRQVQYLPSPPAPQSAPAPTQQPAINYEALLRAPPPASSAGYQNNGSGLQNQQTIVTTTTNALELRNEEYAGANSGGQARRQAAARGEAALQQFDRDVQARLIQASNSACPMGLEYFVVNDGYLCRGTHHFVSHDEVDAMLNGQRPYGPYIEFVNGPGQRRMIAPWRNRLPRGPRLDGGLRYPYSGWGGGGGLGGLGGLGYWDDYRI